MNLVAKPRPEDDVERGFVILFKDRGSTPGPDTPDRWRRAADREETGKGDEHLHCLEEALRLTCNSPKATIGELEVTNWELKPSDKEYHSPNEAIATSKKEIQSLIADLTTVDGELGRCAGNSATSTATSRPSSNRRRPARRSSTTSSG